MKTDMQWEDNQNWSITNRDRTNDAENIGIPIINYEWLAEQPGPYFNNTIFRVCANSPAIIR